MSTPRVSVRLAAGAVALLALLATPASAGDSSYGVEHKGGALVSGVLVKRSDPLNSTSMTRFVRTQWIYDLTTYPDYHFVEFATFHCPPDTSCTLPSVGNPVVIQNNEWYAYGRFSTVGSYWVLKHQLAGPGPNHYFGIYWYPDCGGSMGQCWVWYIDATNFLIEPKSVIGTGWGTDAQAGLERVQASGALNNVFTAEELKYTQSGSGWVYWAGRDNQHFVLNDFCGLWLSDTQWRAGQPDTTC